MTISCASLKGPDPLSPPPLVLLAGPTAAGKTSLALALARRLSAEIVNADSMQVYRRMDIGTAKPTASEREMVRHHLIDVADPDEPFDAARYIELARPVVEMVREKGKVPLVVGGTGLYMKVLTRGICWAPPTDPDTKEELLAEERSGGLAGLYSRLLAADPEAAARIHAHDRQRILRALEVYRITGVALSAHQKRHGFSETVLPAVKIFIFREREELYERINRRVDEMVANGLEDEVRRLISMGFGPGLKSMQSLGYKQMALKIEGKLTLDEAVYLIKRDTRRYAKRQMTWFRGDPEFCRHHAEDLDGVLSRITGGPTCQA
ncbi:MAG: tRNA (adenosine(37)-N6)-dimethylallyltransferase MiaA [Syntrophobacteraceae bacterium]